MIKNLIQSVLRVVGSENMLRPNELETIGEKTIAEIFNEEKETKENPPKKNIEKISERS